MLNDESMEQKPNQSAGYDIDTEEPQSQPPLPFDQIDASPQRCEAIALFQDRDDACKVPNATDIDLGGNKEAHKEEEQDGEKGDVRISNEVDSESDGEDSKGMVNRDKEEDPKEGIKETLPNSRNNTKDFAIGNGFLGIDASDTVDNGRGGEKGKGKNKEEVSSKEKQEFKPSVFELFFRVLSNRGRRVMGLVDKVLGFVDFMDKGEGDKMMGE